MSATESLNSFYCHSFLGLTLFGIAPYTETFKAVAKKDSFLAAAFVTAALTFVVPVLPVLASFTFFLASIAMLLTAASMLLTYPVALIADAVSNTCCGSYA
jgi:hypothetical protein